MTEGKDNEETNVIDERDVLHLKCVKPQHKANKLTSMTPAFSI